MASKAMFEARSADKILTHYITLCMKNAGLTVDGDTYAELACIISGPINHAINEAVEKAVKQALSSIPPAILE